MAKIIIIAKSKKEASMHVNKYDCGCEIALCHRKHDCMASHPCRICRMKVTRNMCSAHRTLPFSENPERIIEVTYL